jgi:hypothetical protein
MVGPTHRTAVAVTALAAATAACSGPTDPSASGAAGGETVVLLSRDGFTGSASRAPLGELAGSATALTGKVSFGDVKSIDVTITSVQVLSAGANEDADGAWRSLAVTSGGKLDLLALPTQAANAIQVARGTLAAGTYTNLRLLFADAAAITFAHDVTAGGGAAAVTYEANTPYPLDIPGGAKTGIKVPLGTVTVPPNAGATIAVTFSSSASTGNIEPNVIATPHGVKMTPVLVARGHSGSDH